ncbi:hypothetical protein BC941DRAFT_421455 [Chlamydoabsidia padenii]|nr:hypothetical protein BC941DRAFT_421455 [Chlamydoabsidia padenii]
MFQQFKNIFPSSTSLNIRSLADSVGLNDEEWRTRGMEGLEALRSELYNINTLLSNRSDTNATQTSKQFPMSSNTMHETARLINRLEQDRDALRKSNLDNINKAKAADNLLRTLLSRCQQHNEICTSLSNMSSLMESTRQEMKTVTSAALSLKNKLMALEDRIDQVCVDYEQRELEEWKQSQEANMQKDLAGKRQGLEARQEQLDQIYEEHIQQQAKEKLELYDINFKSELENYKRRREAEVSSLYNNHSTGRTVITTLENLNLDNGNHVDLDHFLTDDDDDKDDGDTLDKNKDLSIKPTTNKAIQEQTSDSSDDDGAHIEILADEDYESD